MFKLQPVINKIIESGNGTIPDSALDAFKRIKKSVDNFITHNSKLSYNKKRSSTSTGKVVTTNRKKGGDGGADSDKMLYMDLY